MRTKVLFSLVALSLTVYGSVVKTPTNCSSRPCQYVLDCGSALCSSGENAELQASLNDAWRGDTIVLTAGKTWSGNFAITARSGTSGYLTITSSAAANLPAVGTRITPSHAGNLPKLRMINSTTVLSFPAGATAASHIRLIGIEIFPDSSLNGNLSSSLDLVRVGEGSPVQNSDIPDYIEFERSYIHGSYFGEVRNGILGNGNHVTIRDSYISEIKMNGVETHAFVAYNSAGPFSIRNNYLEATSIPVLIGGGPQTFDGALPANLDFYFNLFYKPLKWYFPDPDYVGVPYTNKNMLEFKIGDRSTIRWNVFDQNFEGPNNDQAGQAVAFNIRLPNGLKSLSYAKSQDFLFANNVIRKSLGTYSVLGSDPNFGNTGLVKRLTLHDNLFQDIGCAWDYQHCTNSVPTFGRLISGGEDFVIENNTMQTTDSQALSAAGFGVLFDGISSPPIHNLTFRNNLTPSGAFGWKGDGLGIGAATVNAKTTGAVIITNNVMPGQQNNWSTCQNETGSTRTCSGNFFPTPAQWDNNYMKWTDPPKDFKLRGEPQASPYWKASTSKGPLGADTSQLPLIRNLRISPSSRATVISWDLTQPVAAIPCVLEVSTNRNLVSRLNSWTVVDDVNPVLFAQSDSSTRPGNLSDGLRRVFVVGKDAVENGHDRRLSPGTTYYYRIMCGGDGRQGSFQTTAEPLAPTRSVSVSVTPPRGRNITQMRAKYGEKETGAPQTLVSTTAAIACTSRCLLAINGASQRPQYIQVEYLDAASQVVATQNTIVVP